MVALAGSDNTLPAAQTLVGGGIAPMLVVSAERNGNDKARARACRAKSDDVVCIYAGPYSSVGGGAGHLAVRKRRNWSTVVLVTSDYETFRAERSFRRCGDFRVATYGVDGSRRRTRIGIPSNGSSSPSPRRCGATASRSLTLRGVLPTAGSPRAVPVDVPPETMHMNRLSPVAGERRSERQRAGSLRNDVRTGATAAAASRAARPPRRGDQRPRPLPHRGAAPSKRRRRRTTGGSRPRPARPAAARRQRRTGLRLAGDDTVDGGAARARPRCPS